MCGLKLVGLKNWEICSPLVDSQRTLPLKIATWLFGELSLADDPTPSFKG